MARASVSAPPVPEAGAAVPDRRDAPSVAPRSEAGTARRPSGRTRVLHVIDNLDYGGMERLLGDIVRRLDPDEFEPHVLALRYLGRFARGLDRHARVHLCDDLPPWSLLWPDTLAGRIREIDPDVVHSHSGVWFKAARAARMAGVPSVVHTEHGRQVPDPWTSRILDHLGSRKTDVTVAVSEALEDRLVRELGVREEGTRVVINGVDTGRFRPAPAPHRAVAREALGLSPEAPILGSVGRLEPVKAYGVMLEAFRRLVSGWPGRPLPALVLAGDGSERERLSETLDGTARERVLFLGWRDDVPELHAAFDLFTLSSRSEGTSVSLLEAMSAGVCPVVTDVGGNARVLGPSLRHRLVPAGDPDALAAGWRRALHRPARRERDERRARERVLDRFSVEAMVEDYERIYRYCRREPGAPV